MYILYAELMSEVASQGFGSRCGEVWGVWRFGVCGGSGGLGGVVLVEVWGVWW